MLIKPFRREVRVTFENVNDNRAPRNDVAMLRLFVQTDKASDDVGTEPRRGEILAIGSRDEEWCKNLRDKRSLRLATTALPLLSLIIVHAVEDLDVSRRASTLLLEKIRRLFHEPLPP